MQKIDMEGVSSEWHYLVNERYALKNKTIVDYDAFIIHSVVEAEDDYDFFKFLMGVANFMSYRRDSYVRCDFLIERGKVSSFYTRTKDYSLFFELRIEWR